MKIERIYILSHVKDIRRARCCVASIRRWYPNIAITLIKDANKGTYSTEDFERYWDVDIFQTTRKQLGYGFGKLEPLFETRRQRCFIIDSDTVFLGRVLDQLEQRDDDFIVEESTYPPDDVRAYYLDLEKLKLLEPSFQYPGYVFNSGQFVATTGILTREDFAPYVVFTEPAHISHGEVFKAGDQGILNFTLMRKAQTGEITLSRAPIMRFAASVHRAGVAMDRLTEDSPYPFLLHWAGPKHALFNRAPLGYVLSHFEAAFYARIPHGRWERFKDRGANLLEAVLGRRPWHGYA